MGFIRTLLIQLNWWCSGTRSFPAFFFRKTTLVAESNFLPEAAPIFVILHTFPLLQPMQAEQSSLSKTLKRITGLLKYKKTASILFISLSFCLDYHYLWSLNFVFWASNEERSQPEVTALNPVDYCSVSTHIHTHIHTWTPSAGLSLALP